MALYLTGAMLTHASVFLILIASFCGYILGQDAESEAGGLDRQDEKNSEIKDDAILEGGVIAGDLGDKHKLWKFEGIDYDDPDAVSTDTRTEFRSCFGEYFRCLSINNQANMKICYYDVRDGKYHTAYNICEMDFINCKHIRATYPDKQLEYSLNVALYEGDGTCHESEDIAKALRDELPWPFKASPRPPQSTDDYPATDYPTDYPEQDSTDSVYGSDDGSGEGSGYSYLF